MHIRQGGYSTACSSAVATARRLTDTLRILIQPYLLRRLKIDVLALDERKDRHERVDDQGKSQHNMFSTKREENLNGGNVGILPLKREQIIFCKLTKAQRFIYEKVCFFRYTFIFICV